MLLQAIQAQCAGHADEFSRHVYQLASDALLRLSETPPDKPTNPACVNDVCLYGSQCEARGECIKRPETPQQEEQKEDLSRSGHPSPIESLPNAAITETVSNEDNPIPLFNYNPNARQAVSRNQSNLYNDLAEALQTNCLDHYAHKIAMAKIRAVLERYWPCEPR
jgi:hypothetical protein